MFIEPGTTEQKLELLFRELKKIYQNVRRNYAKYYKNLSDLKITDCTFNYS